MLQKMTREIQIQLVSDLVKALKFNDFFDIKLSLVLVISQLPKESAWHANLTKLYDLVKLLEQFGSDSWTTAHTSEKVPFSVFTKNGNKKLPFVAFSSLPGFAGLEDSGLCPGAGECTKTCYSARAWRYPAAFARQYQNTLLLSTMAGRSVIRSEFDKIKLDSTVRLYVDGDFRNVADVTFWMALIQRRPDLQVYGYSKSFGALLEYDAQRTYKTDRWPENYAINISSGHNSSLDTVGRIKRLPIYRGEFIALGKKGNLVYNTSAYRKEALKLAKDAGLGKVFVCPGLCGNCTTKTQACGDKKRFGDIPIVILTH